MPLFIPIIIGGLSLITSGYGLSKVKEGLGGIQEANRLIDSLKEQQDEKFRELDRAGQRVAGDFENLGKVKIEILGETFGAFAEFTARLKKRVRKHAFETSEDRFAGITPETLQEFEKQSLDAKSLMGGGAQAFTAAAAAGQGAASLVGAFGVASTGTAIGGLSGAAATNAMLAWLGGGSLAAGGGGMALGQVILGGIYLAPATLIGGLALASQGQKALTEAKKFNSQVRYACAKMDSQIFFLTRVRRRIDEFQTVLLNLDTRAKARMDSMVPERLDPRSDRDMQDFACLCQLMSALWNLTHFSILTEDGDLNGEASEFLAEQVRKARV